MKTTVMSPGRGWGGAKTCRGADEIGYLVPLPEQVCREEALSVGQLSATHWMPAFEGVYWVSRPSCAFTHANPRAQCSFGYSRTGEI